jgi:hypothetical protein
MTVQPDYCVLNFWSLVKKSAIFLHFTSPLAYV